MKKQKPDQMLDTAFEIEELDDAALAAATAGVGASTNDGCTVNEGCNVVAGCGASSTGNSSK